MADLTRLERRISYSDAVQALFEGALCRTITSEDVARMVAALENGFEFRHLVTDVVTSAEFKAREPEGASALQVKLPNLRELYPQYYEDRGKDVCLFHARSPADIELMEGWINEHRYYDSFAIWYPHIDRDKRVTASIIQGLGARSCLEVGCYAGSILSVLKDAGIDVTGVEISHRAFVLAHQNIHQDLRYGNLIDLDFDRTYDAVLAMDVLEHLSPLKLPRYVEAIEALLSPGGFAYVCSPMFGHDDVFGTVSPQYVAEWTEVGDASFWLQMHCDANGWPAHGHLTWASPVWWENLFKVGGLIRDREIERHLHELLAAFYTDHPFRRDLFVLRRVNDVPDYDTIRAGLNRHVEAALKS